MAAFCIGVPVKIYPGLRGWARSTCWTSLALRPVPSVAENGASWLTSVGDRVGGMVGTLVKVDRVLVDSSPCGGVFPVNLIPSMAELSGASLAAADSPPDPSSVSGATLAPSEEPAHVFLERSASSVSGPRVWHGMSAATTPQDRSAIRAAVSKPLTQALRRKSCGSPDRRTFAATN
ncbi:hypothetical protein BDV24DRAFT_146244 [Aspergillus arachidicola]|uniref:Uncharacterized protein n=1 Tax=Aspergillus arachidicola TaxID=656916 RepID=A0A5N6XMP3_9EURO|nr:hypothetical protein BDV24DRAFT_146244 [Aspergillus arachidicola]